MNFLPKIDMGDIVKRVEICNIYINMQGQYNLILAGKIDQGKPISIHYKKHIFSTTLRYLK